MGKTSRFLDIKYVVNSIIIKMEALRLKLFNGPYPYDYFKDTIEVCEKVKFDVRYQEAYHALSYLNVSKAEKFHAGDKSITQEIILALVYFNDYISEKGVDKNIVLEKAILVKNKGTIEGNKLIFYINEDYTRFDLKGQYSSGIVQGKAASLFVRCYTITQDKKYLEWAIQSLNASWCKKDKGGSLINLTHGLIWVEEYPSPKPSMVLNGFLFYCIALVEYLAQVEDNALSEKLDQSLLSVLSWLPKFKQNKGLLYSMYRWNLCNVHYTGIMKYQFEHLYTITSISEFKSMAEFTDMLTPWESFKKLF